MNINDWITEARPHAWAIRSGHPSLDAIESVLDLHESKLDTSYDTLGKINQYCDHCNAEYPCPTVRVIETALKEHA